MAAVVDIYEMSASMSGTDKTSGTVRFKLADNVTVDSANPITIPSSGVRGSYRKRIRMYCATAPSTYIDNFKAYMDGANNMGTGITVNASNYSASLGLGGTFPTNATLAITGSVDLYSYTSGSPADLDAIHTASVTASGFFGDVLVMQMVIDTTATSGQKSTETLTMSYDEI